MDTRKIQLLDTLTKPGGLARVPADFRARRVQRLRMACEKQQSLMTSSESKDISAQHDQGSKQFIEGFREGS